MGFYTVWVRSLSYRGKEPLTYACDQLLMPGSIVEVPLQREQVLGFVAAAVAKPSFKTKPVSRVLAVATLPKELVELAYWLRDFYGTTVGVVGTLLLPAALNQKTLENTTAIVVKKALMTNLTDLTTEQSAVVKAITKANTYLLHGRTGSGKTRVYVELAAQALQASSSAIILTPEIGLTSQLAQAFQAVFAEQVIILHSQLTLAQRQRIWLQISQATAPLIIVGPRSALFTPLKRIGLIVIDEAHEPAYKQEQAPYYHARTVASELARLQQAKLLIGSATPSINDYFLAQQRAKPILEMNELARSDINHKPTKITIIDLKDRSQFSRSQQLSQPLVMAIQAALSRGEQSLVYLNRRGTARAVLCEQCGWQALCPHCDLPLVYHADSGQFRCHTCGYHELLRTSCPSCGHPSVLFKVFGTKAVTEDVQKLFPGARVQRFDTDNLKADRLEAHYDGIKRGEVDILVGTQLLAKGLDLPKLSTIGIIQADSSLAMPDFSAQERTYQLICQALGRVGRGHTQGYAVLQTYNPDSQLLQAAIKQDYSSFYNTELKERQTFHFPPFYHLLKLSCRRASYSSAENAALKVKTVLSEKITAIVIDGPAPSFYEKLAGQYQCQLVVRSTQRAKLLEAITLLPATGWTYDIDPMNLL